MDLSSSLNQSASTKETGPAAAEGLLSSYELGRKLKQLRLRKKIALVDLGKHTGLSASMLSQLENGKLIPTLPTLVRIALVFDVGLEHFFAGRGERELFSVVRAGERMRFPDRADSPAPAWFFECLAYSTPDKGLQAFLATFAPRPREAVAQHVHDGAEFIYVLAGELAIHGGGGETILRAGDTVYFDGAQPHGYRATGDAPSTAIVITTPPRL